MSDTRVLDAKMIAEILDKLGMLRHDAQDIVTRIISLERQILRAVGS